MQVKRIPANRETLERFADKHNLVLTINERTRTDLHQSLKYSSNRFYASFENVDVKDGSVICGNFGNGGTELEAIRDYAEQISGKLLVFDAFGKNRREFYAPELYIEDEWSLQ